MKYALNLDNNKRSLWTNHLNSRITEFLRSNIFFDDNVAYVSNGYRFLKSAVEDIYKCPFDNSYIQGLADGFSVHDELVPSLDSCQFWIKLQGKHSNPPDFTRHVINNYSDRFIDELLKPSLEYLRSHTGANYIAWRLYSLVTDNSIQKASLSYKWHYDVHIPEWMPYCMIYLTPGNHSVGSTAFLPFSMSAHISSTTGYISTPVNSRASSLSNFRGVLSDHQISKYEECPTYAPGSAIFFHPNKILHKGIAPQDLTKKRHVIHFSFVPVDSSLSIDQLVNLSIKAMETGDSNSSNAPYYYEIQSENRRNTQVQLCPQSVQSLNIEYFLALFQSTCGYLPTEDFIDYISVKVPCSLDQLLTHIYQYCEARQELKPLKSKFAQRVQQTSFDSMRYSAKSKEQTFWPNPIHPAHPNKLSLSKPYIKKIPIIDNSTKIVTAGSCFASELSRRLILNNFNYLVASDCLPQYKYSRCDNPTPNVPFFSSKYGIIFNSASLLQLAQRALSIKQFKQILVHNNDLFYDPYREGIFFHSKDDYQEDYERHSLCLKKLFSDMDVFVFTLGLNECWRFIDDKTALSRNPRVDSIYPFIEFHRLSLQENISNILEFYRLIKRINPEFTMVLTLSPIPLIASAESGTHVIEANCVGKATLRIAIEHILASLPEILYFPAYEYVTHCIEDPWDRDGRHVKSSTADAVFNLFMDIYHV